MEVWKPVPGHNFYEASNLGRVRSIDREVPHNRYDDKTMRLRGKILKQHESPRGHKLVGLADKKKILVHRIILETFVGPCPEGQECRHLDGNPSNNRVDNLVWGSRRENCEDRIRLAESPRGSAHWNAKLCEEKVIAIRKLFNKTNSTKEDLANLFDVSATTIMDAVNGRTWSWLNVG